MSVPRFLIATAVNTTRSLVAFVVLAPPIYLAVYVGGHPFDHSRSDGNPCRVAGCIRQLVPSQAWWQIPAAVAIGLAGLAVAGVIACWRRKVRPERPLPIPAEWPVRRQPV